MSAVDRLREKYEKAASSFSDRFRWKDGENEVRILPRSFEATKFGEPDCKEDDCVAYIRHAHYNIPQPDGTKTAKGCPKDDDAYCALCDLSDDLMASDNASDKALGKELKQATRFSMNILDLKNPEEGVQATEQGPGIMGEIVKFINAKYGMLVGLKNGRDITVKRTPKEKTKTGFPKYDVYPDPNVTDITDRLPKGWEQKLDELKKNLFATPSSAEIIDLVKQIAPGFAFPGRSKEDSTEKPKQEEKPKEESKEKPKETSGEESKTLDELKCFGDDFSPKANRCANCEHRQKCKIAFLES